MIGSRERLAGSNPAHAAENSAANYGWLSGYAKVVVFATFVLIFLGGLVTSWQAGMAVPDWPLSFGSLNPHGWWEKFPVRLEHGHRMFASFVGLLVTVLCASIWRNFRPIGWAIAGSVILSVAASLCKVPPLILMHISIWSFAAIFAATLVLGGWRANGPAVLRWLSIAAFVGVCLQATLGGLRVTVETAGNVPVAQVLRIAHGCVAQAELCLLVAIAALLSPRWFQSLPDRLSSRMLPKLSWTLVGVVYVQLIFGATMRHLGAGLAIPTFPHAAPSGSWMPAVHNAFVDLNFTHTRFGAFLVTALVFTVAVMVFRQAPAEARLAWVLLALVGIQITLGVLVIWYTKPRTPTTIHVVNGALILSTSLLLALRLGRRAVATTSDSHQSTLAEAAV